MRIAATLMSWCDEDRCDLLLTTGGTGLTERDVTPEATLAVIQREVPGLTEALRGTGRLHTPYAVLSRGVAGTRGRTLIVNLPGSSSAVTEGLDFLSDLVGHAIELMRGTDTRQD